uniref:Chromo domain-containing protein n=1 Tax=Panagrolaimus sp. PS1159 TaxID=55785 RepID=A0AC35FIU8_9BILA
MSTNEHIFEVEKILKMRVFKNGDRKFKLRWKGFSSRHDTWEVEKNLDCPDLLNAFLEKYKKGKNDTLKYEQYDGEKEDYFRCMSCSQANSENDNEEYVYQSRAHRDDGLVHSEPHTETCQPFSFETHDIQTRLSTSVSKDIEWYYHNSFTKFELLEANNNNDAPERVKVYQEEDSYWMFIKSGSNEFKCENCLKLGWTTLCKFVDEKVMTQSHHPIC